MSKLWIYKDSEPENPTQVVDAPEAISERLAEKGIRFERWQAGHSLSNDDSQEQILAAYAKQVEQLKSEHGFKTADVINVHSGLDNLPAIRQKFLKEHTHSEPEVRFFVDGQGLFYLHLGSEVYIVLCEKNDLLFVPAGTTHWFDMGTRPDIKAIRLFTNEEGWVANYTGSEIAATFPYFDTLVEKVG